MKKVVYFKDEKNDDFMKGKKYDKKDYKNR